MAEPPQSSSDSPDPPPSLEIDDPSAGHRVVSLDREIVRLGRGADSDIQILVAHVSKAHAEIHRRVDEFVAVDANSKAGLFVNGKQYRERVLSDGDIVTFGPLPPPRIVFRRKLAQPGPRPGSGTSLVLSLSEGSGQPGLDNLSKFLEFSRLLGGQLTVSELLRDVVDLAVEITSAERGLLILDGPDGTLDFQVARHRDKVNLTEQDRRVTETIVREVLRTGRTRVVSDVGQESSVAAMMSVVSLQLGSVVAMPMWRFALPEEGARAEATDEIFGVLYLDSRDRRDAFSRIDIGILETLARDASSVIENARLLREAKEKDRLREELERAGEVQAALLPQSFWSEPHFELAGCSVPCHDLGGDYFEQFRMPDGRCGFVIADVSGKGLPAALLAATLQGALAAQTSVDQPLDQMAQRINQAICKIAPEGSFITFFCGTIDPDGTLSYVDAGHGMMRLAAANGDLRGCERGDMALGFLDEARYRVQQVTMAPGEVIVLYTDGVTETDSPDGELFGEERVGEALRDSRARAVAEIVDDLRNRVRSFSGDRPFRDDLTVVALKYRGAQGR